MDEADRADTMDLDGDPFDRFAAWLNAAETAEIADANAMTVSTLRDGRPTARILLLKGLDPVDFGAKRGFVFFTNNESAKGEQLRSDPHVCLLFYWKSLGRQVRIEGAAAPIADSESDLYFRSRPRGSRIGAWASHQSRPLDSRETLLARMAAREAEFEGRDVPRPPHWGGWRVTPSLIEFWMDRAHRLHERLVCVRSAPDAPWTSHRLNP